MSIDSKNYQGLLQDIRRNPHNLGLYAVLKDAFLDAAVVQKFSDPDYERARYMEYALHQAGYPIEMPPDSREGKKLERLAKKAQKSWFADLKGMNYKCRLGLPSGIYISSQWLGKPAFSQALEKYPITDLEIREFGSGLDKVGAFLALPHLEEVESLCLSNVTGAQLEAILHSPRLSGLKDLKIGPSSRVVGSELVQLLVGAADNLRNLEAMTLTNCGLGNAEMTLLAGSCLLDKVHTLRLYGNDIGAEGMRDLANSEHVGALRELEMPCANVGDGAVEALIRSPLMGNLDFLSLRGNRLTDSAFRPLRDVCVKPGLDLDISNNDVSTNLLQPLVESRISLGALRVDGTRIRSGDIKGMVRG